MCSHFFYLAHFSSDCFNTIRCPQANGYRLVHAVAKSNCVDLLAMLHERGEDLFAQRVGGAEEGITPLHMASQFGAVACVEFLLQHGAGINASSAVSSIDHATAVKTKLDGISLSFRLFTKFKPLEFYVAGSVVGATLASSLTAVGRC